MIKTTLLLRWSGIVLGNILLQGCDVNRSQDVSCPANPQQICSGPETENLRWDYDEIAQKLIVRHKQIKKPAAGQDTDG